MIAKILKNGVIGATSTSAAAFLIFAIRHQPIDVLYVWSWAMLAAVCYGYFAVKLSIYGKGSNTRYKWKTGLLGVAIIVGIEVASSIANPIVNAPPDTSPTICVAALLSMAISDALA